MPETGWMHEKFTASEKRDAAASWAKDLAKAGMSVVEGISGTGRRYATEATAAIAWIAVLFLLASFAPHVWRAF